MKKTQVAAVLLAVVGTLGISSCGGGSGSSGGSAPPAKDQSTIKVAGSSLGDVLVDGSGRTLYLFTKDSNNANSMNCDPACQKLWPPLAGTPTAGDGADASLIGATTAAGPAQATYAGHPLYYYAKDGSAGDLNGQGIDKVWYVLDSKGTAIEKAVPAATKGGGGYSY